MTDNAQKALAELAKNIAELTAEVRGARVDITTNHDQIDALRREFRDEVRGIYGEIEKIRYGLTSSIEGNKKKLLDLPSGFKINWLSRYTSELEQ